MTLDFETIRSLAHGAEYTEIKDGGVHFSRFTRRERELLTYGVEKSFATAGVRLEFETDSKSLALSVSAEKANPKRSFYSFDVYADGKPVGYITNCEGEPNFPYTDEYTFEDREEAFVLPEGEKRVCVYFPWSAVGAVKAVELDDGAFVKPAVEKRKIIAYGDSITQGYDSLRPSHSYAARLAGYSRCGACKQGNRRFGFHAAACRRKKRIYARPYHRRLRHKRLEYLRQRRVPCELRRFLRRSCTQLPRNSRWPQYRPYGVPTAAKNASSEHSTQWRR